MGNNRNLTNKIVVVVIDKLEEPSAHTCPSQAAASKGDRFRQAFIAWTVRWTEDSVGRSYFLSYIFDIYLSCDEMLSSLLSIV